MMKLELFRSRNVVIANAIALIIAFGMLGIFFPMTIFLQSILDFSAIRAGLTMAPMSAMILIAAPVAGRLSDRVGARWLLVAGTSMMAVGILFIIARTDLATDWRALLPALAVTGLGMGLTFSPMTAAAMREVPPRIAGSASGILNTLRNVGQVLGIAVLGSFLQHQIGVHVGDQLDGVGLDAGTAAEVERVAQQSQFERIPGMVPEELLDPVMQAIRLGFTDSLHDTFLFGAAACAIAAVIAVFIRNPEPRAVAGRGPAVEPPLAMTID
jgi:MFS family permease